ncbi:aldose 1-epimerase family protein [Motilibacter deserti]|uniref:Aldose 1-epimerase family protein n=1 Tax=Motilibacter deserti TaxID=2714956 RepID=A0ABX0GVP0_9ACTN|nr:aldose 1-epimerase family protein [Motilibacter deserti]NHC14211.1 aldose 1-epimerase family protein [Motilibacter deserti]
MAADELGPVPASGRQIELRSGDAVATVVEVGGGLRTYSVGGRQVVDGYGADEMAPSARGSHLIPWPNRIRQGLYAWEGKRLQLPITEHALGNASHGLTRWHNWRAVEPSAAAVTMALRLHPSSGYPFTLDLALRYELSGQGLAVTVRARNVGARPAPFAYGAHPYVMATPGATIDADTLHVPAASRVPVDATSTPTGRAPVEGTPYDFRKPSAIGDRVLDTAYTDLRRTPDGRSTVTLRGEHGAVVVWQDESFGYTQVFTGDTVAPERRRRSVAVEPMTSPANAFSSGEDVVRLEPGQVFEGAWGITPS